MRALIAIVLLFAFTSLATTNLYYGQSVFTGMPQSNAPGSGAATNNFVRVSFVHNYPGTHAVNATITNTVAGNALLVYASGSHKTNSITPSITSSAGNSFNLVTNVAITWNTPSDPCGAAFIATSIVGGDDTIAVTNVASSDMGITIIQYSGVSGVNCFNVATNCGTPGGSVTITNVVTTSATVMFSAYYFNEFTATPPTSTNYPGAVSATSVNYDGAHIDALMEWLNSAAGYGVGTYTNVTSAKAGSGVIFIGLK